MTSFVNLVSSHKLPAEVHPIFGGASLIALRKKDGGVRPIAVGLTLRRLVAKCHLRMLTFVHYNLVMVPQGELRLLHMPQDSS